MRLAPSAFVVLGASLACMAAVPAAFWLADIGVLPWAEELRWDNLRAEETHTHKRTEGTVQLWRSGCFGHCPVYSVKLSTSGRVEFDGVAFTCSPGLQVAHIPFEEARELLGDIADVGYFDVTWNQGTHIDDASNSVVALEYGGRRRSLPSIDANSNAPRLLRRIARAIDDVAGTQRWLPFLELKDGIPHGERFCRGRDGSLVPTRE